MKKTLIIGLSIVLTVAIIVTAVILIININHEHKYAEKYSYDAAWHWIEPLCHQNKVEIKKEHHDFVGEELVCKVCSYKFQKNTNHETIKSYFNNVKYSGIDLTISSGDEKYIVKLRNQELYIEFDQNIYVDCASDATTVYLKNDNGTVENFTVLDSVYTVEEYLRSNEKYDLICQLIDNIPLLQNYIKYDESTGNVVIYGAKFENSNMQDVSGRLVFHDGDINKIRYMQVDFSLPTTDDTSHKNKRYTVVIGYNTNPLQERFTQDSNIPSVGEDGYIVSNMRDIVDLMEILHEYVIVDVREKKEFDEGHIAGAINIPNSEINKTDIPEKLIDCDKYILIYCQNGNRSKDAAAKLVELGFDKVVEFGGIKDWKYELEKESISTGH